MPTATRTSQGALRVVEGRMSKDEERRLARRYKATGDPNARRSLVENNFRFVCSVAHRFAPDGYDPRDLIQEGCIGLMRALDRFDPERGHRRHNL